MVCTLLVLLSTDHLEVDVGLVCCWSKVTVEGFNLYAALHSALPQGYTGEIGSHRAGLASQ